MFENILQKHQQNIYRFILFVTVIFLNCAHRIDLRRDVLAGKVICIDPGHGGTAAFDDYRVGPTGEREEWVDLRVGLILRDMLEARGATILMTRMEDVDVPLKDRALLAVENQANVFISIHHNATADPGVNFPIIYFHGNASENRAGVLLGRMIARELSGALFNGKTPVSLVSDHTIFPNSGTAVLRHSYGIPGIIGEASFFSNPEEEQRLKDTAYNRKEASAYVRALETFFQGEIPGIDAKRPETKVPPFRVFQEAERMHPEAKLWLVEFQEGERLYISGKTDSLEKAYDLFTRSAKSFPDSWVAGRCHAYRAEILDRWGDSDGAAVARRRVDEYYIEIE